MDVTAQEIRLGSIMCPSGRLVIADAGHLGLWSGQEPPVAGEALLSQISDPRVREGIIAAADLEIAGPDAEAAARGFGRQAGRWLYDIPAHGVAQVQESFTAHCVQHGLDAHLEQSPRRIPHRERVDRAADDGGGEFLMYGVPVVTVGDLPTDRLLPVTTTLKDFGGRVGVQWEIVTVHVREGEIAESRSLGHSGVDWARLILADADSLSSWQHEEPVDGLADVAFWGRSVQEAAAEFDAAPLGLPGEDGVHGWRDLDVREAVRRAIALEDWQEADPRRRVRVDFRPHSHHWQVMAELREHGAGHIDLDGARMLCFVTGEWGDGFYPVHTDHDSDGRLMRIRIVLGDEERRRRTEAFRERWA